MKYKAVIVLTTLCCLAASSCNSSSSSGGASIWVAASVGIDGADIRGVAVDPSSPSTVYIGSVFGGVFKSIDGGASWASASLGLTATVNSLFILGVVIDPVTTTTLYVVTAGGVFKSTNGASSWFMARMIGLPQKNSPGTPVVSRIFLGRDNWIPNSGEFRISSIDVKPGLSQP